MNTLLHICRFLGAIVFALPRLWRQTSHEYTRPQEPDYAKRLMKLRLLGARRFPHR